MKKSPAVAPGYREEFTFSAFFTFLPFFVSGMASSPLIELGKIPSPAAWL